MTRDTPCPQLRHARKSDALDVLTFERTFEYDVDMGRADDLAAIELLAPWTQERFRADLAGLRSSTAEQARRFADDARLLAGLAGQVPRLHGDERGASPWVSFTREVAVAASISDRAATGRIRHAVRLVGIAPVTLAQLDAGVLPAHRAQAFLRELDGFDDRLARQLDRLLGERIARWAPTRIGNEVRAAAARLDAEAVVARAASKNADRKVELIPDAYDQATVILTGPAVPLVRWHGELDRRARALRAAGDSRTLDQLRFDLATGSFPCDVHVPIDPTAPAISAPDPGSGADDDAALSAFGLRPSFTEAASTDCRRSRPVKANLTVPVETSLGLSNEPGWLDGYGWLSAPTCRLLLVDAELRRLCVQAGTGQLVTVDDRLVRPEPTPAGLRRSVLDLVLDDITLGRGPDPGPDPGGPPDDDPAWREEPQHDPSIELARYVQLRDRFCDGPTQSWIPAAKAQLDHDEPWPTGPTAAWNLVARGQRTHLLKHNGWTALRTPTSTIWISPAGQTIETDRTSQAPPGIDTDHDGWLGDVTIPDPVDLHALDLDQLTPRDDDDLPPWIPAAERPPAIEWHWLNDSPVDREHLVDTGS